MQTRTEHVVDLTEANFAEVIGRSRQVPVLVDFWADWCAPCKQMAPVLDKLVAEYRGAFVLAKVNADREQLITQQFGVRGLPTLKLVYQGQLAGELVGAQPEAAIRRLLASVLTDAPAADAPVGDFLDQVRAAADAGQIDEAIAALEAQLRDRQDDHAARTLLVEILLQGERLTEAGEVLAGAPADAAAQQALRRARALLAFANRIRDLPPLAELEAAMGATAGSQVRHDYAVRLVALGRIGEGMDLLLDLLRRDRQFGDDAARRTLLEILDLLGREDPLSATYRRKLASFLH